MPTIPSDPGSSLQGLLEKALEAHRAGRIAEAEPLYQAVLDQDPENRDALHLLGMIALGRNDLDRAVALVTRAIAVGRPTGDMHNTLGIALRALGRLEEALTQFAKATAVSPSIAQAWLNRGSTLLDLGRAHEALKCYRRSFALDPTTTDTRLGIIIALQRIERTAETDVMLRGFDNPTANHLDLLDRLAAWMDRHDDTPVHHNAHHRSGLAFIDAGQVFDAIAAFERALQDDPHDPYSQTELAQAYMAAPPGAIDRDEIVRIHRRSEAWCDANSEFALLHYGRGGLLKILGRQDEAEEAFMRSLEIDCDLAVARMDLAILLLDRRYSQASLEQLEALPRRIDDRPRARRSYAAAERVRAAVLLQLQRSDEAVTALRAAIALDPGNPAGHNNLASALSGRGELDVAMVAIRQAMQLGANPAEFHSNLIFFGEMQDHADEAAEQAERKRWYKQHGRRFFRSIAPHPNDRSPDRRLRVGYVSGDFKFHAAARVIAPVLFNHDPQQVELACYSNGNSEDWVTDRFRSFASRWRNITDMPDESADALIREDGIDILVDLSGHTAGNRLPLFARKPAPIQVTAWGLPRGTGLRTIDYIFSDPVLIPPQHASALAEQVVYLPCWMPYSPLDDDFPVAPAPGIATGSVTFGTVNRRAKLSDRCLAAWAEILHCVPDSRLLVIDDFFVATDRQFHDRVSRAGLPAERVELRPRYRDRPGYLGSYSEIDLLLDSFPQGGGVTSFEALWMGVPMIALLGKSSSARGSAAILSALGLTDFIADSVETYIERAVAIAGDPARLAALRSELRGRMLASPICDGAAYTRLVESAYRDVWRVWCAGAR